MKYFTLLLAAASLVQSAAIEPLAQQRDFSQLFKRQVIANVTPSAQINASANASTPAISIDGVPSGVLNSTAWALIYTYPFAIFANVLGGIYKTTNNQSNVLANQLFLAGPDSAVIKPNTDVLYSRVALDLSQGDVVLTVPNITDRYWVYPGYLTSGDVVFELGIVNNSQPGDYLIRRLDGPTAPIGLVNSTNSSYQGVINFPASYGTLLLRLAILTNSTEEINELHGYQNATKLRVVPRNGTDTINAPALNTLAPNGSWLGVVGPARQLSLAASLLPYAQTEVFSDRDRVRSILATAGISNGTYTQPSGDSVNLTQAAVIANNSIQTIITTPGNFRAQSNGWLLPTQSRQGNFSTNYASAAYVALFGYQQQTVAQTLYPGYQSLGFTTEFTLQPNTSLLVTFSKKPPLTAGGFWSLSVYGGQSQQLIPNPLYRFKAGSQPTSNLTYADGSRVYGSNSSNTTDQPFQILVQSVNATPPANWTNNWLPTTSDFTWLLRWYVPSPAFTNGSYEYPLVQVVPSITA